jgi:hypothetical protein
MTTPHGPIAAMSSSARRPYFKHFLEDVFVPQRKRLLAYSATTCQTAQVDSDGYLGQMIASIVLGVPGNARRGKTGVHAGDLLDGTEIKGAYRTEQMNGMEDSHVNFGQITREKMQAFMDRERAVIIHTSYDVLGKVKIEVLGLPMRTPVFIEAVKAFHARSTAARPQLQPRLYPDGKRDVLQTLPGHFLALGAKLLARAVVVGDEVIVDKWSPDKGLPLQECLDLIPGKYDIGTPHTIVDPEDPDEFFANCMIAHRRTLIPYCESTGANQNVGFGNLSQHLVSVVTGKRGTHSGARGFDLEDRGEIKLAMGHRGDPLGTEDFPRLNLQRNKEKMLEWESFYPVRIVCDDEGLKVKVLEADIEEFRDQVRDYFGVGSLYENSPNLQYHAPKTFESNVFSGKRGDGTPRLLDCKVLYCAEETSGGACRRY